jgi:hypothetical protein
LKTVIGRRGTLRRVDRFVRMIKHAFLPICVLLASVEVAVAQAPPSPATPPAPTAPPASADGVLCPPPGVDPQIRAPTPNAGNTPVIPPPGSPGGNPDIRPK